MISKGDSGKIRKRVLVTGACRSGTTTMSWFLRKAGLRVRHEKMGEDGTVSCMFFIDAPYYPKGGDLVTHKGEKFSDYEFEHIIHLVRNPLKAIPSQAAVYSKMQKIWLDEIGWVPLSTRPNLLHAAKLWLKVNRHVGKMTRTRIRIEDLEQEWPRLQKMFGFLGEMPEIRQMNKSSGFFKRDPIWWDTLGKLDGKLTEQIYKLAVRYGYESD